MEQCGATSEEACCTQVEALVLRYQQLLAKKQAIDREQREARWAFYEEIASVCLALHTNQFGLQPY